LKEKKGHILFDEFVAFANSLFDSDDHAVILKEIPMDKMLR
jgi:hypothetical protein